MGSLNRRNLLTALMAATTLDPEKLLYVPGKKLISIPRPKTYNFVLRVPRQHLGSDLDAAFDMYAVRAETVEKAWERANRYFALDGIWSYLDIPADYLKSVRGEQ